MAEPARSDRPSINGIRSVLKSAAAASATPYGYTLSIWCSGAILMQDHGLPRLIDVFAFLIGGLTAFGAIVWFSDRRTTGDEHSDHPINRILAGALHWFAAGGAVGAVSLTARLPGIAAWAISSFAATVLYLLMVTVQLMTVARLRG